MYVCIDVCMYVYVYIYIYPSRLPMPVYTLYNTWNLSLCTGNPCPADKPFLCRSSFKCIALKFVCDDTYDCDDGFDEEKAVCNAGWYLMGHSYSSTLSWTYILNVSSVNSG